MHVGVPLGGLGHELPHAPQLPTLTSVFISQPSTGIPLQSAYVGAHVDPHTPWAQTATPLGMAAQALAHEPQWLGSNAVLVHVPLQLTVFGGHASWHWPVTHASPAPQVIPQAPQFAASLCVSTQASAHFVVPPKQERPH